MIVSDIDTVDQRVSFDELPFVPTIQAKADVFGPGAFTATLEEPLEGGEVDFAKLSTVAGLSNGALLRFVRSPNLILQPGPYYPFEPDTTVVVIRVVENTAGDPPIEGAAIAIDQINDKPITTTMVGGLGLHTVTLTTGSTLLLGPDRAVKALTNARGDAILYFPSDKPVTKLRTQITRAGYANATESIDVAPKERTSRTVRLDRA